MDDLVVICLDDVLFYVSGVVKQNNFGGLWDNYLICGFFGSENGGMNIFWNGFVFNCGYVFLCDIVNVESIDFFKGLVVVLYGNSELGGIINVVIKKLQFKVVNLLDLLVDSCGGYCSVVDFIGVFNSEVVYWFNVVFEYKNSFCDNVSSDCEFLVLVFIWVFSDWIILNYEGEYLCQKVLLDCGIVVVNGNLGVLLVLCFLGELCDGDIKMQNINYLLMLEYCLDDNWYLCIGVFYKDGMLDGYFIEVLVLQVDNVILCCQCCYCDYSWYDMLLQVELGGKLQIGGMQYEVLVGMEVDWFMLDQCMLCIDFIIVVFYVINIYLLSYGQV